MQNCTFLLEKNAKMESKKLRIFENVEKANVSIY